MKCNYAFSRNGSVFYFKRVEYINDIDLRRLDNGLHMIVDHMKIDDTPFIEELAKKCAEEDYFNLAIMDDNLTQDCATALSSIAALYPSTAYSRKIVVPISAAVDNHFSNSIFVGTFVKEAGIVFAQPINAGQLTYSKFRSVFSIATDIINDMPSKIRSDEIDSITWIDNWFQKHIQYIKQQTTIASGTKYVCDGIEENYTAEMSDVFLRHFGVCEDIASSIAILLHMLKISYKEVQANGHAWLLVNIKGVNYIWDCTHNITRNKNRLSNALKATSYSNEYTLIGENTFPAKYDTLEIIGYDVSQNEFSRDELLKSKNKLSEMGIHFTYSNSAVYPSHIEK